MNNCNLVGYIVRNNEIKTTANGKSILKNVLAVKKTFKNADGEYDTNFINITAFGPKADFLNKYTSKGSLVAVSGEISTGSYEKEDGTLVHTTDVIIEKIRLLNTKKENKVNETTKENTENDPFATFGETVTLDDGFLD